MSTSTLTYDHAPSWSARVADMIELTNPRIAVMVLLTVAIAAVVESWGQPNPMVVLNTLLGTLLVASSATPVLSKTP